MKKNNPHVPIMMREALGIEPRVYARYGMNHVRKCPLVLLSGSFRIWQGEVGIVIGCDSFTIRHVTERTAKTSMLGLSDKEIEDSVTGLVKTGV